ARLLVGDGDGFIMFADGTAQRFDRDGRADGFAFATGAHGALGAAFDGRATILMSSSSQSGIDIARIPRGTRSVESVDQIAGATFRALTAANAQVWLTFQTAGHVHAVTLVDGKPAGEIPLPSAKTELVVRGGPAPLA